MTGGLTFALTFLVALGSGIMAGLFFVFSNSVMAALGRLPAEQGIAAMQAINLAILNPPFLAVFLGTTVLSLALVVLSFMQGGGWWPVAGAVFYVAGILVVTMGFNVPLNDALAAVAADSAEGASLWTRFLAEWSVWNHVRTASGIAALACFIMALR